MDKIAICVTTRNRRNALDKCIEQLSLFMPQNSRLFIVDDASEVRVNNADYRFDTRVGIPQAKNKCLELSMDYGADHIFLFDDDIYPIKNEWEQPYIRSEYKHLCFTFLPSYAIDETHKKHHLGNGCMLYIHKDVIKTIGGFDISFGLGKYEHTQFSHRAKAAGFCPTPYVDVINSGTLFHSMDQYNEVDRTFTLQEMSNLLKEGKKHFHNTLNDLSYYGYK